MHIRSENSHLLHNACFLRFGSPGPGRVLPKIKPCQFVEPGRAIIMIKGQPGLGQIVIRGAVIRLNANGPLQNPDGAAIILFLIAILDSACLAEQGAIIGKASFTHQVFYRNIFQAGPIPGSTSRWCAEAIEMNRM